MRTCMCTIKAASRAQYSQPYLSDASKLAEDVVHFVCSDVEGQVTHIQTPA